MLERFRNLRDEGVRISFIEGRRSAHVAGQTTSMVTSKQSARRDEA